MLDRDCEIGGHQLDVVTVTNGRTPVIIEVKVAEPDAAREEAAITAVERMLELLHAGAARMHGQDGDYTDFQVESAASISPTAKDGRQLSQHPHVVPVINPRERADRRERLA